MRDTRITFRTRKTMQRAVEDWPYSYKLPDGWEGRTIQLFQPRGDARVQDFLAHLARRRCHVEVEDIERGGVDT